MKPRPRRRPAGLQVEIMIDAGGWESLDKLERLVEGAARAALRACGRPGTSAISVLLTDDQHMRALNHQFRDKDSPTNVLSFPIAAPPGDLATTRGVFGDIALAFETIAREAASEGKTIGDHVSHLVVHGTLHLAGFDHDNAPAAERMEALEIMALASLGIANPYLTTPLESEDQTTS